MRHQYTPIFRDLLTSSLWATSTPATKCVWIVILLDADPEGYVPMSVPGLAMRAGVSIAEVELALGILEGADPYSRTKTDEGRRLRAVDHGWHVTNFVSWRARAVHEAEKARKRNWAASSRSKVANDNGPENDNAVDASSGRSETLDAPLPLPKSRSPKKENGSAPLPVIIELDETIKPVFRSLAGWEPSEELRADALLAGIADFDERVANLRTGPIGGQRGVLDREDYVRAQLPKWRRWAETEKLKAQRDAEAGPGARFGRGPAAALGPHPKDAHKRFAAQFGLDLTALCAELVRRNYTTANYREVDLDRALERALVRARRAAGGASAQTRPVPVQVR